MHLHTLIQGGCVMLVLPTGEMVNVQLVPQQSPGASVVFVSEQVSPDTVAYQITVRTPCRCGQYHPEGTDAHPGEQPTTEEDQQ